MWYFDQKLLHDSFICILGKLLMWIISFGTYSEKNMSSCKRSVFPKPHFFWGFMLLLCWYQAIKFLLTKRWLTYGVERCTAKRKLERLQFLTSSSFVKIWSACNGEFKAYFWTFWSLYHLLFDLETIGVN